MRPGSSRTPLGAALQRLGGDHSDAAIREAAWVARCVGRGPTAPLDAEDLSALAEFLQPRDLRPGRVLFTAGEPAGGVWIVRRGQVELAVGRGRRRAVVGVLHPGDVDGDLGWLLETTPPYTARALGELSCLYLEGTAFEQLLGTRANIARRWTTSVAQRLAASQARILNLLGKSLTQQAAALLCDEAGDGQIQLPQRTLAAMLGVARPSLNKILREFAAQDLIELGYASIYLRDPDALAALAESDTDRHHATPEPGK